MEIIIRQEKEYDYQSTENVVEQAFKNAEHTDHKEHLLVSRLRNSEAYVPQLSLVAELENNIVGHIMFTKLIINDGTKKHESLGLAPVSVLPQYQGQGVGSKLIMEGLKRAQEIGFESVILLGHPSYYPRFGFKPSGVWGIKSAFDVPEEAFMALELQKGSLDHVNGTVIYPKEFFD